MLDRHDHDGALEDDRAVETKIEIEIETDHGEDEAEKVFSFREYQAGFWS